MSPIVCKGLPPAPSFFPVRGEEIGSSRAEERTKFNTKNVPIWHIPSPSQPLTLDTPLSEGANPQREFAPQIRRQIRRRDIVPQLTYRIWNSCEPRNSSMAAFILSQEGKKGGGNTTWMKQNRATTVDPRLISGRGGGVSPLKSLPF